MSDALGTALRSKNMDKEQAGANGGVALLLIDVINAFDFPGSESLVAAAEAAAPRIRALSREREQRASP